MNIRNFVIIAHIDHGKSTLADRFLELTQSVDKRHMKEQYLDQMDLERERGITIKMQPVTMIWKSNHSDRGNTPKGTQKDAEKLLYEDLIYKVRGALFSVKKSLGLGHKEQVYHNALEIEFKKIGLKFESKKNIPILYEGKKIGTYQPDFIVENKVLLELKALPEISRLQIEQIWSYLKGCEYKLALLVNFGSKDLEIKRVVYDTARNNSLRNSAFSPRGSAGVVNQIENYILNLIDTPGHVDFSYEVSRSLAAVEGAILLVDATKGIQAQTLAHLRVAIEQGLTIIPAINKIDLPQAEIKKTEEEILALLMSFNITFEKIYKISAKTGEGVGELLEAIINKIPPPKVSTSNPLRALIFDSIYDDYRGIISYVRIFDGGVEAGDEILFMASGFNSKVKEVGIFKPQLERIKSLKSGDIGYIVSGVKSVESAPIGDTITLKDKKAKVAIGGYKDPQPVVFSTIYTSQDANYEEMKLAFAKLKLNDASLYFEPEHSPILGRGLRCGFLGMLHMEIVLERLRREYNLDLVVTSPSVSYKVLLKNGNKLDVFNPSQYPDPSVIENVSEPWVLLKLITPPDYMNNLMNLLKNMRGTYKNTDYLGSERMQINYEVPLSEIIEDFYNSLKNTTSGYASMAYEILDYRVTEIVKLDILLAGDEMPALSRLVVREKVEQVGRRLAERIKEVLPRQLFAVAIQAVVGGKIIARETKPAARKDVTGYLYGGDITRKKKLLEKQKKGKKRMAKHGKVNIDPETMMKIFS